MENNYDCNIKKYFKLPIDFLEKKNVKSIDNATKIDLELTEKNESNKDDNYSCFYDIVFNPTTNCSKEITKLWSDKYTTDKIFLKNSQKFLKTIDIKDQVTNTDEIFDRWKNFVNEDNFYEKYNYVDYEYCKFLNNNTYFMAFFTMMSIMAPIISLFSPFFVVIIPFFILKYYGVNVSINEYYNSIIMMIKNTFLYQLVYQFNDIPLERKAYILGSIVLYIYQIYINVLTCIRHNENLTLIHDFICSLKKYLSETKTNINIITKKISKYKKYIKFKKFLIEKEESIDNILHKIHIIQEYRWDLNELQCIGTLMSSFYTLRNDINIHETIMFTFGFNGYVENIVNLKRYIDLKKINMAKIKTKQKLKIINMYYPIIKQDVVKNSINLSKNKIITGPNASGKTTILKTTILNVILTQQIGYGFYEDCKIQCFDNIHCYLNIPDTSGRDSLFQAEARRCKDILDIVNKEKNKNHFCIFDELYSGTNPYEAIASSYSFLKHLASNNNITFLLTTHFIDLCEKLDNNKKIENYHMKTNEVNNSLTYKYKLICGISKIKGGVEVLKKLNYPQDIINETLDYLHKM